VSEDSLGAMVPESDDASTIAKDDGIRGLIDDLTAQPLEG
jgi:hypothetical protein